MRRRALAFFFVVFGSFVWNRYFRASSKRPLTCTRRVKRRNKLSKLSPFRRLISTIVRPAHYKQYFSSPFRLRQGFGGPAVILHRGWLGVGSLPHFIELVKVDLELLFHNQDDLAGIHDFFGPGLHISHNNCAVQNLLLTQDQGIANPQFISHFKLCFERILSKSFHDRNLCLTERFKHPKTRTACSIA